MSKQFVDYTNKSKDRAITESQHYVNVAVRNLRHELDKLKEYKSSLESRGSEEDLVFIDTIDDILSQYETI